MGEQVPALDGEVFAAGTIGLKQELGEGVAAAPVADAVSALTNLGYSRDMAANAIAAALKEAGDGAGAKKKPSAKKTGSKKTTTKKKTQSKA